MFHGTGKLKRIVKRIVILLADVLVFKFKSKIKLCGIWIPWIWNSKIKTSWGTRFEVQVEIELSKSVFSQLVRWLLVDNVGFCEHTLVACVPAGDRGSTHSARGMRSACFTRIRSKTKKKPFYSGTYILKIKITSTIRIAGANMPPSYCKDCMKQLLGNRVEKVIPASGPLERWSP